MDRRVTHLDVNRPLNCVLEVVQCICIIISDHATFVILAALMFRFYYFFFQLRRENRYLATILK